MGIESAKVWYCQDWSTHNRSAGKDKQIYLPALERFTTCFPINLWNAKILPSLGVDFCFQRSAAHLVAMPHAMEGLD
jgi:hypothetical protein